MSTNTAERRYRVGTVTPDDVELVARVLDTARTSWAELAEWAGTAGHNLQAYHDGRARMPDEVRLRLALQLHAQARRLELIAGELSSSEREG